MLFFIDVNTFVMDGNSIRWNGVAPIKVNILLSKLGFNKLPTRVNLDIGGIDIESLLCPFCSNDMEIINHHLCTCEMTIDLWNCLATWWELDLPFFCNFGDWTCVGWLLIV